jgi:hypothetical protein
MGKRWKRSRQTPETPSGQFSARPREMLESAAYRVLSRGAHLVLSRIELEHRYHGGKENGRLLVTYEQLERYGLERGSIPPALRELEAVGIIEITQHGRGGNAEYRMPNMFRLTCEPAQEGNVTNDWKRFPGRDDPDADTKMMIEAAHTARMARKNQNPVAVARAKKSSPGKNRKPMWIFRLTWCGKPSPKTGWGQSPALC